MKKVKVSKTNGSLRLESQALIEALDKLSRKLRFEDVQVLDAAIEQPRLYMQACRLRVAVMEYTAMNAAEFESYRSELYNKTKYSLTMKSPGRVTNTEVESAIATDPQMQRLTNRKLVCDQLEELSKGLVESFRQRLTSIRIVADVVTSEGRVERSVLPNEKMVSVRDAINKKYK